MLAAVLTIVGDRAMMPTIAVATALASAAATSDTESGVTICIFRRCTGGYCPGCGGSRSVMALLRGDLAHAWTLHPWVPLLVAQLIVCVVVMLWVGIEPLRKFVVPVLVANLALGLTIWTIRLTTDVIPIPFG